MLKVKCLSLLTEGKVVPAIRAESEEQAVKIAKACKEGGVNAIEITMAVPGALKVVERLAKEFTDLAIGAGTVFDGETARMAIMAGASFVVGPSFKKEIIDVCKRYGVVALIGAFTSTEVLQAYEAGADMIKIFPVDSVGSSYVKGLKAVFPYVPFIAVGGIDLNNCKDFIKAGATGVGVASAIVNNKAVKEGKFDVITENAKKFVEAVQ
jgi:2-dehydro-3-deoxyphosphogluconate aldolase/(4S)-4-hydroxy-2-oxoglutarate aldolase